MKRAVIAVAAALTLEAAVLLNWGACGRTGDVTRMPTEVPTPSATLPYTAPTPQEQALQAQKTLIRYYTAAKGQPHYNDNLYHDLLLTRHYIYNPQSGKMGVVVVIERRISSFYTINQTALQFGVKPFQTAEEALPYMLFAETMLPKPEIDYDAAPQIQGIIARFAEQGQNEIMVPVGLVGEILAQEPERLKKPFRTAQQVAHSDPPFPVGKRIESRDRQNGRQLFVAEPLIRLSGNNETLTFYANGAIYELPVQGAAVMEQVILDTQEKGNAGLLLQLGAKPQPTPMPQQDTFY